MISKQIDVNKNNNKDNQIFIFFDFQLLDRILLLWNFYEPTNTSYLHMDFTFVNNRLSFKSSRLILETNREGPLQKIAMEKT